MKRVRMERPELKTWDDVNEALRLIAEAQNEIAMMEAGMNVQIDTIKQAYEEKVQEYKKQIKQKELLIKEFTTDKRDQLDGKTKDLTFGKVGFRKSTKLQLPKALDKVIAALRPATAEFICSREKIVFEKERLKEASYNIKLGCKYLSYLCERFPAVETALCAYNAGEGTVRTWLKDPELSPDGIRLSEIPYSETRAYLKKILKYRKIYENLYR